MKINLSRESILHIVPAAFCLVLAVIPIAISYARSDGRVPFGLQVGIVAACLGAVSLWLIGRNYPAIAPYPAMMVGALLLLKPVLAPIMLFYDNPPRPFPIFSETHLYFVLPGAALVVIGFIYLLKKQEP